MDFRYLFFIDRVEVLGWNGMAGSRLGEPHHPSLTLENPIRNFSSD